LSHPVDLTLLAGGIVCRSPNEEMEEDSEAESTDEYDSPTAESREKVDFVFPWALLIDGRGGEGGTHFADRPSFLRLLPLAIAPYSGPIERVSYSNSSSIEICMNCYTCRTMPAHRMYSPPMKVAGR
jgi:hypothetical protein